ncbi:hypothetical protein KP001_08505 [Geomonas subterranea]|uniref:Uncharacterized protein n=1 Tax=Geomonas subterranea TaxID=2847989 RepID=A0ABX8LQM2_9BACT|nr:hypothetical protein [Geomonas subterranea]QXE92543.1 hypothetical protein KP001_08505 [Geomonas subterranea]QXM09358.1 hypothetical protein KP002_20765 [Geomonas subterranea]
MVRSILEIGNAKYKIDRIALGRFKDEVRQSWTREGDQAEAPDAGATHTLDESLDAVFRDVMQLYNEYAKTESIDVLLRLKDKLEQVSLRYKSLALAEEVLSINSCLPYERRVPQCSKNTSKKH